MTMYTQQVHFFQQCGETYSCVPISLGYAITGTNAILRSIMGLKKGLKLLDAISSSKRKHIYHVQK